MAPILVGEMFKRCSIASPPNDPCDPRGEDQAPVQKDVSTPNPQVS